VAWIQRRVSGSKQPVERNKHPAPQMKVKMMIRNRRKDSPFSDVPAESSQPDLPSSREEVGLDLAKLASSPIRWREALVCVRLWYYSRSLG
jgi:hypothetical protein